MCLFLHPSLPVFQALPVWEMDGLSDVQPLQGGGGGRHVLLQASLPERDSSVAATADAEPAPRPLVVLKGFADDSDVGLRRELNTVARLRHPHIIRLLVSLNGLHPLHVCAHGVGDAVPLCQGVCRQRDPFSWFLVLPMYPANLRQWMLQLQGMTLQERLRRAMPVMRQLVQGLAYLHQVHFIVPLPCCWPLELVMSWLLPPFPPLSPPHRWVSCTVT